MPIAPPNVTRSRAPVALIAFALIVFALLICAAPAVAQNATDNADNAVYNDGTYLGKTGGTFSGPWFEYLPGDGGTFMTTTRQTDGARSFSIFPGTGGYAVGRGGTVSQTARYTVNSRHDLNSETGFSGFNLKVSGGAGDPFESNELVRFGLPGTATPGNAFNTVLVHGRFEPAPHLVTLTGGDGEIRGDVLSWTLWIDTRFGVQTYLLNVTSDDGGSASVSGTTGPSTGLLSLGFGNFNTGSFQDFHFDSPTLAPIPEPTSAAAAVVLLAAHGLIARRRGS